MKSNLKPCPDCGHDVSKNAAKCPHCGRDLNVFNHLMMGIMFGLLGIGIVAVLIVAVMVLQ